MRQLRMFAGGGMGRDSCYSVDALSRLSYIYRREDLLVAGGRQTRDWFDDAGESAKKALAS